jgi:hypothetical protein
MIIRESSLIHAIRARRTLALGVSACLLLVCACGSDASKDGTGDSSNDDGSGVDGSADHGADATTITDPAKILGLSSDIRCSLPSALPRAELRFETPGGSARLPGHVVIATEDEISLRVVCSNPEDRSETLAILLAMRTGSEIGARTYTKELPAIAAADAVRGGLELKEVRGSVAVQHSAHGVIITTLEEAEPYGDYWFGNYETDRSGSTHVTAGDATRARLTWTDAFTAEVTSVVALEEMSTRVAVGPNDGILDYEYHGTLSLELVPTLLDGETPDPLLEAASVSATF